MASCAHWPFNIRPEAYYRGVYDVGAEVAKDQEDGELEEDESTEKLAAKPRDLAEFLASAIEHFEQRFDITPEGELETLHLVVKKLESKPKQGHRSQRARAAKCPRDLPKLMHGN